MCLVNDISAKLPVSIEGNTVQQASLWIGRAIPLVVTFPKNAQYTCIIKFQKTDHYSFAWGPRDVTVNHGCQNTREADRKDREANAHPAYVGSVVSALHYPSYLCYASSEEFTMGNIMQPTAASLPWPVPLMDITTMFYTDWSNISVHIYTAKLIIRFLCLRMHSRINPFTQNDKCLQSDIKMWSVDLALWLVSTNRHFPWRKTNVHRACLWRWGFPIWNLRSFNANATMSQEHTVLCILAATQSIGRSYDAYWRQIENICHQFYQSQPDVD